MATTVKECTLEEFYNNVKDCDGLAVYNSQKWALFARLIAFFTEKNNINLSHVLGGIYDIQESKTRKTMNILEYKTTGAYFNTWVLEKRQEKTLLTSYSNYTDIYWLKLKQKATNEQIEKGYNDALELINKKDIKYTYIALPLTLNKVYTVVSKLLKFIGYKDYKLTKYNTHSYFCTSTFVKNMIAAGVLSEEEFSKDMYKSPIEVLELDIFEVYKIKC